jgi:hypothetical protein
MFGISLDRLQQRQTAYFTLKSFWLLLLASWRIRSLLETNKTTMHRF